MINKKIMTKKECLQDLKELLANYPLNRYRLFKYGLNWHYIDNDYYIEQRYKKKLIKDEKGNVRSEFNDFENQKDIIIIDKFNIDYNLERINYGNYN